jgi:DNA-binding MarR family transcriptional regulator
MDAGTEKVAEGLDDVATEFIRWARTQSRELSATAATTLGQLQRSGPARLTDLAAVARVSQQSMTTLIAKLSAEGLVRREPDPNDRRAAVLTVTAQGADLVRARRAARTDRLVPLLNDLAPGELRSIAAAMPALTRLTDALRRSRPTTEVTR